MTATLFVAYVGSVAVLVVGIARRYLPNGPANMITIGLPLWLAYVATLSWFGVFKFVPGRPPGVLLVFPPVIFFVALAVVRSRWGSVAALTIPLPLLLGLQSFRVGVELFLHQLWAEGLAPKMLTYEGANVDIVTGLTAPLVAWIATRGRTGLRVAMLWSALGLIAVANVITRSVLTAPGPLNVLTSDIPNTFVGVFPYGLLPGLFPPLAIILHVLAIKAIRIRLREAVPAIPPKALRSPA